MMGQRTSRRGDDGNKDFVRHDEHWHCAEEMHCPREREEFLDGGFVADAASR